MNALDSLLHAGERNQPTTRCRRPVVSRVFVAVLLSLFVAAFPFSSEALAANVLQPVAVFGSNPGALNMYVYAPRDMPDNAPVVVAMHGCFQQADDYVNAGWNEIADALKFYVIYPEQSSRNNPSYCFNWAGYYGNPADMTRGQGENQSVKSMVDYVLDTYNADAGRVYVTGFSAGAAMAAVMLATWPDVFSAGTINAGVPYYCGDDVNEAFTCMSPGKNLTPNQWGDLVRQNGFPRGYAGPLPRVGIFHGTRDSLVAPQNMNELMEQWTNVNGIDQQAELNENLVTAKGVHNHREYHNAQGEVIVATWEIDGMDHGVALDNGATTAGGCGNSNAAYFFDEALCSTYLSATFFGLDNADSEPPVVTLSNPSEGSTVSGTVLVSATASDGEGVAEVAFLIDGAVRATDVVAPFTFSWNTSLETNGSHRVVARATDVNGNQAEDAAVVTVQGGLTDGEAPTVDLVSPADGASVAGAVALRALAQDNFGVVEVRFYADGELVGTAYETPWEVEWDTADLADGPYALSVEAEDAAGNVGVDDDTEVVLDTTVEDFSETFSSRGADNDGWRLNGWRYTREDHTGGRSLGLYGEAQASFNTTAQQATLFVKLGSRPVLGYWRKMDAYVANSLSDIAFRVLVDGEVVDEKSVGNFGAYAEANWRTYDNISLSDFAGREVALTFEVEATDPASVLTYAKAWIDDIEILQGP